MLPLALDGALAVLLVASLGLGLKLHRPCAGCATTTPTSTG